MSWIKAERFMQSLNPEQRFKMAILQTMIGTEEVAGLLISGKVSIDELFAITADRIYG